MGSRRGERVADHPLGGPPAFYKLRPSREDAGGRGNRRAGPDRDGVVAHVGKALNPAHVEIQDEGAAVMGLGHTLMEQLILDDHGRIRNLGALDYRIPTTKDVRLEIQSIMMENADGPGPYHSKGAGEGGLLATAPAVASAVTEATGVVIRELPLTAERIWRALRERSTRDADPLG